MRKQSLRAQGKVQFRVNRGYMAQIGRAFDQGGQNGAAAAHPNGNLSGFELFVWHIFERGLNTIVVDEAKKIHGNLSAFIDPKQKSVVVTLANDNAEEQFVAFRITGAGQRLDEDVAAAIIFVNGFNGLARVGEG